MASLTQACTSGNVEAVRVLLKQGELREGADDGDSLLSLAASAGYYELCQVCVSCDLYALYLADFHIVMSASIFYMADTNTIWEETEVFL